MQPKKLALIHDMCGIGHCSMTVALPIVSVMGIQGCPVPTAIFSGHTAYKNWHKVDFTDQIPCYLEAWDKEHVHLDGIYCGYLGSGAQVNAVLDLVKKHPDALFFLDPVMGDHGALYSAITDEHILAMKTLVSYADSVDPFIPWGFGLGLCGHNRSDIWLYRSYAVHYSPILSLLLVSAASVYTCYHSS